MAKTAFTFEDYQAAANAIIDRLDEVPRVGIILGSGLAPLAESVENTTIIPYEEIPHWPTSGVKGHKSRLVIGTLEGRQVLVMQGRAHFYEGYTMQQVTFPVRVMQALELDTLIVTNAAGGINTSFSAGDIMLIEDHINLLGHMGQNALMGPNDPRLGERFPIFTRAYDLALRAKALEVARAEGIALQRGVYCCLSGPAFETPAEIRMFRAWGADAVGMSTAPEVTVARHGEMRVLGFSTITNVTIDHQAIEREVSHESVLDVGARTVPNLIRIIRGILRDLPAVNG
ncbi:MAG: purine-nucleoside phosphorylase [Chloroflexi bacterium]|nr:purine-nucleoside phosphorylase [Chloroflexota bacterium]